MTRSRLILAIRVCVLLALAVCLFGSGLVVAGLSSLLVGLFMPVFATLCGNCTTAFANQYQIVVRNLSQLSPPFANCACTDWNGTWTVTQTSSTPSFITAGTCYAEYQINPCLCSRTDLANQNTGQKFSINRIAFWITTTADDSNNAHAAFLHNTAGTDCTVLNNSTGITQMWTRSTSAFNESDCAGYSSLSLSLSAHAQCNEGSPSDALVTAI